MEKGLGVLMMYLLSLSFQVGELDSHKLNKVLQSNAVLLSYL